MAECHWLAERAQNLQNSCIDFNTYRKSLNDLLRLTAQRRKSTNGFEGQNHKNKKEGATALKEKKALVAGIERFCETTMVGGSQYSVIKTEFEAKWGCQSSTGYQRRPK